MEEESSLLKGRTSWYKKMAQVFSLKATKLTQSRVCGGVEVLQESASPVSTAQHSQLYDHFVVIIGVGSSGQDWVGMEEGHELWLEVSK